MNEFHDAKRVQTSLLSPLESYTLGKLVRFVPASISPDFLTFVGLLAMIFTGACYYASSYNPIFLLVATIGIFVNWLGDSLDGNIARYRNIQRPRYGFYIDHIVDAFGIVFLVVGLVLSGLVSIVPAVSVLVGYLILSINAYLITYVDGQFQLSEWKMGPTEFRVCLVIINIIVFFYPRVDYNNSTVLVFDIAGWIISALLVLILVSSVLRNAKRLRAIG